MTTLTIFLVVLFFVELSYRSSGDVDDRRYEL
jgi:hypothetical protein